MTTENTAIVERHEDQAVASIDSGAGAFALAMMSDAEFERRIMALRLGKERIARIQRELMTAGEDYGVIPGTGSKPTLLKPGAEIICRTYSWVPTFAQRIEYGDGNPRPPINVHIECKLHLGDAEGPVIGVGVGTANSFEKKYRYRAAQRACPSCGCAGTLRRSRFADRESGDKGWYCHDKSGGCGAQFKSNDPKVVEQQAGVVDNPDPFDVENTLVKMAVKRAQVDAALRASATSGLFTQDLEDNDDDAGTQTREQAPREQAQSSARAAIAREGQAATGTQGASVGSGATAAAQAKNGGGGGTGAATAAPARDAISTAQAQAFWKWTESKGIAQGIIAQRIRNHYGCQRTEDLTQAQLDDLKAWIMGGAAAEREPGDEG